MSNDGGNVVTRVARAEHIGPDDTGDNIEAKRSAGYVFDDATNQWSRDTSAYRYSGGKSAYAQVINTAGDNTIITPASGNRIRIFWVAFVPDPDNASANLVTVSIGATPLYTGYALAHWEVFTGATDESVVVTLTNNQDVAVTIHYQEIT